MKTMCPPGYYQSPQWLCGNSCTWAHDVRLYIYIYIYIYIYMYIYF